MTAESESNKEKDIVLYTWATPNGRKVSIALEEMGLAYETVPVNIGKDEQFSEDFLKISPNNKIPAIVDKSEDVELMESGAILFYLAEKTNMFKGPNPTKTMEWLMWQMGGVGPMFGQVHHFLRFNKGVAPYAENRYRDEAHRLYGVLDKRLSEVEYLADEYSVADMATWPWVSRWEWHEMDWSNYPNVERWYRAIASRPAVQRGYDVPVKTTEIPLPA